MYRFVRRNGNIKRVQMERQILRPKNAAFVPEWNLEDVRTTFVKCVGWQVEETLDPFNCPYHYYCDSAYPGNYPAAVDVLVLVYTTISYLATLVLMVVDISRRGRASFGQSKRYLLPSGPISLPIILLMLAKGHRINTAFPLSCVGPAILQLVYISALTFNNGAANEDIKYAFFEASTISGILHASLYLDSVILPYYTGFDALVSSSFSGECASCVCRKEVLVLGGKLVTYRGWSLTTYVVVGALCLRIVRRGVHEANKAKITAILALLESLSFILIIKDSAYLVTNSPPEQYLLRAAAYGGLFVLICLHLLKKACVQIIQRHSIPDK